MPAWTPSLISPHTWIDFSDTATLFDATSGGSAVTNGVGIARAEDKSGNGRHFTQSALGNRFTWTEAAKNSLGLARSTGNKWMTSTASSSTWTFLHSTPSTIYVVVKNGDNANPGAIYSWYGTNAGSSSNTGVLFSYDDRGLITGLTDCWNASCTKSFSGSFAYTTTDIVGTAIIPAFSNIITPNVYGIFGNYSDPSNATALNRMRLSINGASKIEGNVKTIAPATWAPTYNLQIGAAGNSNLAIVGDYCELIIFSSLLSTTDQQLTEGYLAWKWGLHSSLPSGHPYKNAAPLDAQTRRRRYSGSYGL